MNLYIDNIPVELRERRQWLVWKPDQKADGKVSKVPCDPHTRANLKQWTNPDKWLSFEDAISHAGSDGIGFAPSEDDPYICIDLDNCISETGELNDWTKQVVAYFNSYTEVTPSRRGLHIWFKVDDAKPITKTNTTLSGNKVEMYCYDCFLTFTGATLSGGPVNVEDRSAHFRQAITQWFPSLTRAAKSEQPFTPSVQSGPSLSNERVLEILFSEPDGEKWQRLFEQNDWALYNYASQSEADFAMLMKLAFYCGRDGHDQIDELFQQSSMYGQHRYSPNAHAKQIDKAISRQKEFYGEGMADPDLVNGELCDGVVGSRRGFRFNDQGNALRLIARHGLEIRYCPEWKKWLAWDGTRWAKDETGEIMRLAKETIRSMYTEAASITDDSVRSQLGKWAHQSEARSRLENMIYLAQTEAGGYILSSVLDVDPWLFNCRNGTLDLRTGQLKPHCKEDFITKLAPVDFAGLNVPCPYWEAHIERFLPDPQVRQYLQRAAGYSLTGDISERVMFLLHGNGSNGKTIIVETLTHLFGDYGLASSPETFMLKRDGGISNDIARLKGARLVSSSETEESRQLAESLVKRLTGGDTITARFLYAEAFDFRPSFKIWLRTNHLPEVKGTDPAIWDRLPIIPFNVRIHENEKRRHSEVEAELRSELPGILAWAVRGCLEWQTEGLRKPQAVVNAIQGYRTEQDAIGRFLADRCEMRHDGEIRSSHLYTAYTNWCESTGEKAKSLTSFGHALRERGIAKREDRYGISYTGITHKPLELEKRQSTAQNNAHQTETKPPSVLSHGAPLSNLTRS